MVSARRLGAGVAGAAAFLCIAASLAFWSVRVENDRSVQRAAAPLLGCPASRIVVRERSAGDAAEWYRVRGCGRDATLICNAPDYDCFVAP
jgi:hypothetical protein